MVGANESREARPMINFAIPIATLHAKQADEFRTGLDPSNIGWTENFFRAALAESTTEFDFSLIAGNVLVKGSSCAR
jgi:hypothetical protein